MSPSPRLSGGFDLGGLKTFPRISAEAFQHPDDRRATEALQQVPLFPQIVKTIFSGFVEKVSRTDQITSSFRLGPNQGRPIYRLFRRAAEILDVETLPELYLSGDFSINATAFGMKRYMITLYAPLVSMMDEGELMAIIGHELGHVKCAHMTNKTLAHFLATYGAEAIGAWVPVLGPVAAAGLALPLLHWSRMAELSCDRAALLVVQDPNIVVRALSKLAGWSVNGLGEINFEEVSQQLHEDEQTDEKLLGGLAKIAHSIDALLHTHPLPLLRMKKIHQWGKSDQFREILGGTYPKIDQAHSRADGNGLCLACGQAISSNDSFCATCGAPQAIPADVALCPNESCRRPVVPDQRFCSKCGHRLEELSHR